MNLNIKDLTFSQKMPGTQLPVMPSAADEAQHIVDIQNTTQHLRALPDPLACAGGLPAEVLTNIFEHIVDSSSARGRMAITHVCHYWREVALGCASIWTSVPFLNPAFTDLALECARHLPLTVRVGQTLPGASCSIWEHSACVSKVLCLSQRLKHISIVVDGSPSSRRPSLEEILSGCTGVAPLLESLYLECSDHDFKNSRHRIPRDFLGDGTPSLRSLGLINCAIRWKNIPFASTLTHLRLSQGTSQRLWYPGGHFQPTPRPSIVCLLGSLRRCPALVELELKNYLPKTSDHTIPGTPPPVVTLPSLIRLSLDDEVNPISVFLQVVQIPKVASLALEFVLDDGLRTVQDFRHLLIALERAWKDDRMEYRPLEGGPCHLEINGGEFEYLPLTISLQFAEWRAVRPVLVLAFNHDTSLDWSACFQELVQQLGLSALVSLLIEDMDDYVLETDIWTRTLAHCTRLQQIEFKYCSGQLGPFINAFQCHAMHWSLSSNCCPHSLWLPALAYIHFEEAKFQHRNAGSAASVAHFLHHQRSFTGKRIDVKVEKCSNFHYNDYRDLLSIQGLEVDWDGEETVSDTDEVWDDSEEEAYDYSDEGDM